MSRDGLAFSILGTLEVRASPGAEPIKVPEACRVLLARLLVRPGQPVTVDSLNDALWGDELKADVSNSLHQLVRTTRRLLGDEKPFRVLVRDDDAYRLVAHPVCVDAVRFRRLAQRGGQLLASRPAAGRAMLAEALSMWRGPLLGTLADRSWAQRAGAELERVRLAAQLDLNEARLMLGDHVLLERELPAQIERHPDVEPLRTQLVRALHASGRTVEAMLAYRHAIRDLGTVGPELRRVGDAIASGAQPHADRTPRLGPGRDDAAPVARPDAAVLCAVWQGPPRAGDSAVGTAALVVDDEGGRSFPLSGQRLLAAFDDLGAALRAAAALVAQPCMSAGVALHVGGVVEVARNLFGPAPAVAGGLASAAGPSQVLLSAEAAHAADDLVPRGAVRALGEHRFADLHHPRPVFALVVGDPDGALAEPRSLDGHPHNLPVVHTRFVGRRHELEELSRRIASGRIITLVGQGGCGKTRLALQIAAQHLVAFADGAWVVSLTELADGSPADRVAAAAVQALGERTPRHETATQTVARHLADRRALLILDNCEHVHEACAELAVRIRDAAPEVCILATSRRPLPVSGGIVVQVPGLAVAPETAAGDGSATMSDAMLLLVDRAGFMERDAAITAAELACCQRICEAVEGHPLAIELAGAHVPTRGLHGVAAAVEDALGGELQRLAQPSVDVPERQRTLAATIAWSHRLLSGDEQLVLRRLAVFRGGFGAAQAAAVAGVVDVEPATVHDLLPGLMEVSLVVPHRFGGDRMRLAEPIRAFALGQLREAGEVDLLRDRHAEVHARIAREGARLCFGPGEQAWLERLDADHDNLRATLDRLIETRREHDALRLVGALWWFWFSHGHLVEGCEWVDRALALGSHPSPERVRALRAASHLTWWRGEFRRADEHNRLLAECADSIDDDWGRAWALLAFGAAELFKDPAAALAPLTRGRERFDALGSRSRWESGYTLQVIGGAHWFVDEYRPAGAAFDEAVAIFEALGHRSALASAMRSSGMMAALNGSVTSGIVRCEEARRLSAALGDRAGSAQALNYLGAIGRAAGDLASAVTYHAEALALAWAVRELWDTCWALDGLAGAACAWASTRSPLVSWRAPGGLPRTPATGHHHASVRSASRTSPRWRLRWTPTSSSARPPRGSA